MRLRKLIKIHRQIASEPLGEEPWTSELRNAIADYLMKLIGKKLGYKEPKPKDVLHYVTSRIMNDHREQRNLKEEIQKKEEELEELKSKKV